MCDLYITLWLPSAGEFPLTGIPGFTSISPARRMRLKEKEAVEFG